MVRRLPLWAALLLAYLPTWVVHALWNWRPAMNVSRFFEGGGRYGVVLAWIALPPLRPPADVYDIGGYGILCVLAVVYAGLLHRLRGSLDAKSAGVAVLAWTGLALAGEYAYQLVTSFVLLSRGGEFNLVLPPVAWDLVLFCFLLVTAALLLVALLSWVVGRWTHDGAGGSRESA